LHVISYAEHAHRIDVQAVFHLPKDTEVKSLSSSPSDARIIAASLTDSAENKVAIIGIGSESESKEKQESLDIQCELKDQDHANSIHSLSWREE
jgi:hypothetical protein